MTLLWDFVVRLRFELFKSVPKSKHSLNSTSFNNSYIVRITCNIVNTVSAMPTASITDRNSDNNTRNVWIDNYILI